MTTIKDIALALEVNPSTVSRALKGSPLISETTRRRIEAKARELGYELNPFGSALAEARWKGETRQRRANLAFLTTRKSLVGNVIGELIHELGVEWGYETIPASFKEDSHVLMRRLRAMNVAGIIIDATAQDPALEGFLEASAIWDDFSWVALMGGPYAPPVHRVSGNAFRATLTALDRICERGYRRIAFLHDSHQVYQSLRRQVAASLLVDWEASDVQVGVFAADTEAGRKAFFDWGADAALLSFPYIYEYFLRGALLPPHASLALEARPDAGIAGTLNNRTSLANACIELIDTQIRRQQRGSPNEIRTIYISPVWQHGRTLPPAHS